MIENWEFCNSIGGTKMIGFKARLVNCREAAYLNLRLHQTAHKTRLVRRAVMFHQVKEGY